MNYTYLVEKARHKDEQAIVELFELTSRKGYFVALKYLKNKEDAQDILQDSYVSAITKLDQLKDTAKFDKWLFQIIANKAKNYLVKNKPLLFEQMDSNDEDALPFEDTIEEERLDFQPKENFDTKELQEAMKSLIDELPDDQRMCLLMYYFDELSVTEISQALEVSGNTVKSRLNYARVKIKTKIEELQKQGTHLYSVSPIPFMLWLLRDEVKATIIPSEVATKISSHVISEVTGNVAAQSVLNETLRQTVAANTKILSTKIITTVVAVSIAAGGGYLFVQSQNDNTTDPVVSEYSEQSLETLNETDYEIISDDIPQFEETPIDIKDLGYIVKVDGKYGFIGVDGKWKLENKYPRIFRSYIGDEKNNSYCFLNTTEEYSDGVDLEHSLGGSTAICSNSGIGDGVVDYFLTLYDSNPTEYFTYNPGTKEKIPSSEFYLHAKGNDYNASTYAKFALAGLHIVQPLDDNNQIIENKYYVVSPQGGIYGPYTLDDKVAFNFSKPTLQIGETKVKGIFLAKGPDGYEIQNEYGFKIYPDIVSNAELISYSAAKVKLGNKIAIIDDFNGLGIQNEKDYSHVPLCGEFEDATNPMMGKAFVKIDGKWKLIKINK